MPSNWRRIHFAPSHVRHHPVWTTPNNLAEHGGLTASTHHLVAAASESVTCSTFNFQRSSALWKALKEAAARTEVDVRIYVDAYAADARAESWKPTTIDKGLRYLGEA